jgi:RNA polymerase sigma factor (TIGR02999 family)
MDRPITQLLKAVEDGAPDAWGRLLAAVYDDLQRLASVRLKRLRPGGTIRTTDLVHESYLRMVGDVTSWENRRHFFGAASRAMRDILVDEARRRRSLKRGGDRNRWSLSEDLAVERDHAVDLIALDDALKKLEEEDELQYRIVMLRYFGGLKVDEVALLLEVSPSTVDRNWKFARAWLLRELRDS